MRDESLHARIRRAGEHPGFAARRNDVVDAGVCQRAQGAVRQPRWIHPVPRLGAAFAGREGQRQSRHAGRKRRAAVHDDRRRRAREGSRDYPVVRRQRDGNMLVGAVNEMRYVCG